MCTTLLHSKLCENVLYYECTRLTWINRIMNRESQPLVKNEMMDFEKYVVEVHDSEK